MQHKFFMNTVLATFFLLGSSLAISANTSDSECAQTLLATVYPALKAENSEEIIIEMKETEKKSGACLALNNFYCLTGNPDCKK